MIRLSKVLCILQGAMNGPRQNNSSHICNLISYICVSITFSNQKEILLPMAIAGSTGCGVQHRVVVLAVWMLWGRDRISQALFNGKR